MINKRAITFAFNKQFQLRNTAPSRMQKVTWSFHKFHLIHPPNHFHQLGESQ